LRKDLIIIGAGPAGLSACLYSVRAGLDTLLLDNFPGGQVNNSGIVENYLGFKSILGVNLSNQFLEHILSLGNKIVLEEKVLKIEKLEKHFKVFHTDGEIEARAILISIGTKCKKLYVEKEDFFSNNGLSYCAICDGALYRDREVAVIGGGNSALDATLFLSNICKKIYLINKNPIMKGDQLLFSSVSKLKNVEILYNVQTEGFLGENKLEGVRIRDKITGATKKVECEGVFVKIGMETKMDFETNFKLETNTKGEIIIDRENRTNIDGVFSAGDSTNIEFKQIVIAAGEGTKAALVIFKYLKNQG